MKSGMRKKSGAKVCKGQTNKQTKKKRVKDPPVKLFEVNQEVGLTSATVSLPFK